LGAYYLDNLTPRILCDWRDKLLTEGKANQTVRHHLGLVSVVYSKAIKHFHTYEGNNPVKAMEKPSVARTGRTRVLTPDEVETIISGLSKPLRAYILLAFETGMRRGEIERIERIHLDTSKRTLLIPITKTGRPRLIPLSPDAVQWVEDLLGGGDKSTVLGDFAYRIFAGQAKKHGIKDARFHDLRHSAVTRFFEKGLGHFEVAAISGHTTMQMLQRYTHISVGHLQAKLYGPPSVEISSPQ
jgi:integrase